MNLVDAKGAPYGVQLPPADRLASQMTVQIGDQQVKPFYASASGETAARVRGRAALVIVDISGSMNHKMASGETRFEAAKRAIGVFLENFEEGADRVAVVPFEGRQVEERISHAVFARTKAEAQAQIEALPLPRPATTRRSTRRWSSALRRCGARCRKSRLKASDNPEAMAIVLTPTESTRFSRATTWDCWRVRRAWSRRRRR